MVRSPAQTSIRKGKTAIGWIRDLLHGSHDDIGEQSDRAPRHRVGQLGLHVVDVDR
jgi:hypothetical protein